jgi:RNA polymerase sigma-70 factor (ECF subfamily)
VLGRIPETNTVVLADAACHEHYRSRVSASNPAAPKPALSESERGSPGGPPSGSVSAPLSDAELVARMVQGDRSAVALLYERHKLPLFALARGMLRSAAEAEDLLHDVFLEAWRRSADYSSERGSVRAWLMLRTRSRALDRLKSAGRRPEEPAERVPAEGVQLPDESVDQGRLRQLLERMPEAQRQVLLLGYFEGSSSAEISERLQIPVGTVKSRTRAALEALRDMLGKGHD